MNGLPIGGSSALVTMRQMSGKFAKKNTIRQGQSKGELLTRKTTRAKM